MNKKITITNQKSLREYMLFLKSDLIEKEQAMKKNSKGIVKSFPSKMFQHKSSLGSVMNKSAVANNPIGKLLSTVVKKTLLKKSGFLFRLVGGIFAKRAGKRIERKLLF
ncbi:hypothetical protein ACFOG5_07655 [Pedobacter fastidiosus]|uniref:Uncharacterized protein n=1 Tax=Pedobacter fastidiosus TaxID=2765361 RepID=A0ABR7KPF3_9SPHI|nr:hypothetical protein [Pedobacter fastidiosus]MBC6109969.1 hypothetical protein [Pedobacter fastidiosus]